MSIEHIERLAREHADARDVLQDRMDDLDSEIRALKRRRLKGLRSAVSRVKETAADLDQALRDNADLFQRPKTRILHGLRVGFMKRKGALRFNSAARVVALIKRHLPDKAESLIKVEEKPIRKALANLRSQDLKKIGVAVEDTDEAVVIKSQDSDVEKLVAAHLDELEHELEEADHED